MFRYNASRLARSIAKAFVASRVSALRRVTPLVAIRGTAGRRVVVALTLVCLLFLYSSSSAGPAQTKLIIARHGVSDYDPASPQPVGIPDPPLSAVGKDQAVRLARFARVEGIEVICHSPLRRARETAEIVGRELHIRPIAVGGLTEFNLGDLLGKDWSRSPYREQLAEVFRRPENKRPGGESFNQLYARAAKALHALLARYRNKKLLIVSHGVTNRALAGIVRGLSSAEAYALPSQPNDEALVIEWKGKVPAAVESRRY